MADLIYDRFAYHVGNGNINLETDTLYVALYTDSYIPDSMNEYYDNTNEVIGTGYISGGQELLNVSWDELDGSSKLDANDSQWTSATFAARYANIYSVTGSNLLICLFDFGEEKNVSNGTFNLRYDDVDGILQVRSADWQPPE